MSRIDQEWLRGRASLGAAGGWTAEEMRLVADLGFSFAEQGRNQEAITIFEGLTALAPPTAYFQSALGALWLRVGEPQRALGHLNAALEADPQDFHALANRGEAYLQLGETAAATRDLQAVLRLGHSGIAPGGALTVARARALLARWQNLASEHGTP